MKSYTLYFFLTILFTVLSCTPQQEGNPDIWKQEIADAEAAFEAMADSIGIKTAFLEFAAEDAVLMRSNKIYHIHTEADSLFPADNPNVKLSWAPDFVDVSSSGDMGYTYGDYTLSILDSLGNEVNSTTGIFHTVWKRQADGSWKYVWD